MLRHSFPGPGAERIALTVSVAGETITMRFEDHGIAFDPSQAGERQRPKSLAEAQPGGLGLMLVRKRAWSVAYERRDGRNVLTIMVARR